MFPEAERDCCRTQRSHQICETVALQSLTYVRDSIYSVDNENEGRLADWHTIIIVECDMALGVAWEFMNAISQRYQREHINDK